MEQRRLGLIKHFNTMDGAVQSYVKYLLNASSYNNICYTP